MASNRSRTTSSSVYAQLQVFLDNQTAKSQQEAETLRSVQNAMDMMSNFVAAIEDTNSSGTRVGSPRGGGTRTASPRPRMSEHQGRRPINPYASFDPEYSQFQHGRGLGGLRRTAFSALARRAAPTSQFDRRYDDQGNHVGWTETKADGSTAEHAVDSPVVAQAERQAGRASMLGMLGHGGAGLRAVPYVGAAIAGVEAVKQGATFVANQRAENAPWQAIYGGSNFSQIQNQRLPQMGFQLNQLMSGGLPWQQSQQAFQGVSALGFSGSQRSSDLNFITSNYMNMGMSVADSLKLVTEASKDFNKNLVGLSSGLKSASDAARNTGQSAQLGRQTFTQQYTNLSQQFGGPGTANVASALTDVTMGMGREMQGLDLSGMYTSQTSRYIMSGLLGESMGNLEADISSGNSRAFKGGDEMLQRALKPFQTQQVTAVVAQYQKQYGNRLQSDPSIINQTIMPRVMRLIQPDALLAALQPYGISVTPEQAVILLIRSIIATNPLSASYSQQQKANQGVTGTARAQSNAAEKNVSNQGGWAANIGMMALRGKADPVIGKALNQLGANTQVTVQTASGDIRTTIQNASIKYADQIAKGTAVLDNGQTIKQALGGASETNYKGPDTTKKKAAPGTAQDAFNYLFNNPNNPNSAASKAAAGKMSGTVKIEPTPLLKQLLNFTSDNSNIVIANQAAANNSVPIPGVGH